MGLRDVIARALAKKNRFREMQTEDRLQETLQARKMSANERELNRFVEEEREARIKNALEKRRAQKHNEIWHGPSALNTPNMFAAGGNSILNQPSIMQERNNLLNQERLF